MEPADAVAVNGSADSSEDQDHVKSCLRSRRVLQHDELLRVSKNVAKWREVGNALKYNFKQLDAFESEEKSDSVYKMLQDWLAWKEDKATVGRLAKALHLNQELEAINSLTP